MFSVLLSLPEDRRVQCERASHSTEAANALFSLKLSITPHIEFLKTISSPVRA